MSTSLYYSVLIIGATICMICFKKLDTPFKWVCVLIILTLSSELIAGYFSFHHKNNGIVYVIFTPIEYFIYTMVYKTFSNDKKWTRILFVSVACLVFLEVVNTIFFQHTNETPTNIMDIESVLLVILSLKLFIDIRKKPVYENVLNEGVFWFNSAVLFYYSFNILFWGFHNIVFRLSNPPSIIYNGLLLFSGLLYIIYAGSILLNFSAVKKALKTG
jgi:hypothetical protein